MDNNEVNTFRYVTVFSVHLDMSSEVSKKPSQKYRDSSQHLSSSLRIVQTKPISFLKSLSENVGSDFNGGLHN